MYIKTIAERFTMQHDRTFAPRPWDHAPYSIKRYGATITNCESEPIQTPGCIQAHGALLVLRLPDLTILQASENTATWLGHAPESLLGQSIAAVLGTDGHATLRATLESKPLEGNPLHLFTLPASDAVEALDVSFHTVAGVGMLEFEATGRAGAEPPDYYALLRTTVGRLNAATRLVDFCQQVTAEYRELTGLDRVMVYRFHPDQHGEVYAESRRDDLPPWLGLHYPAEDIPVQVREIFKKIWIRPLPNARGELAEMAPLVNPDTGRAPDLSYCALRGASVMYTEYLQNMGTQASLTMPILRDGELWGLIACHHDTPTHFPYQTRAACEFLAQAVSLQLKSVEEREHLLYRLKLDGLHSELITTAVEGDGTLERLIEGSPNLLEGLDAGGVALCHRDRWWCCGQTPDEAQLDALAAWLQERPEFDSLLRPVYVTDELSRDYPEGSDFSATASGLLAMSLSHRYRLLLLWFRPETLQTIHWAGSPHDKPTVLGPNGPRLTPRASFDLFVESVKGRSLPWLDVEVDASLRLRQWLMELVIERSERLAALNADLTRSNEDVGIFTNAVSYELKEPLRGITRYARTLLNDASAADQQQRQRLESLVRLSQRMETVVNALLHFSKVGRIGLEMAPADLNEVLQEALKMAGAHRGGSGVEIVVPSALLTVDCDRMRVREVLSCLIDNALRYNNREPRRVEIGCLSPEESPAPPGNERQPTTTYYVRDNGIGIEEHNLAQVFGLFRRLHARDAYAGGIGAGLAIARMLVERHNGRIWAESTPGVGSTFYFTLGNEPVRPA